VEGPPTSQTKEDTIDGLLACIVGAPATFKSFVPTDWKNNGQYVYKLLKTSSFKEGAM
jgi:hypothetical protein